MAKTLEISHVPPYSDSSNSLSDFSLPVTFCDTCWFKFPPVERLFFYSLPQPKQTFLNSTIPRLKRSLSLTLQHFLPLAGNLTWPRDSPKPIILYIPNDSVSLTVAESNAAEDFDFLAGDHAREAASFHPFIPNLKVSETGASVISVQITLFPNRGFCIGVTCHHAVLDGKSTTMFMKSWAHICRSEKSSLPPELTPFYDRSVISDPDGLDMLYVNQWLEFTKYKDPNPFQFLPSLDVPSDFVRATFELSRPDIAKLREKVSSSWNKAEKLHLTSFALTLSYMAVGILKATEEDHKLATKKQKAFLAFTVDYRNRLRPPVLENYFGNCVGWLVNYEDLREILKDQADQDALTVMAATVSDLMKKLEEDVMEGAAETLSNVLAALAEGIRGFSVAGSPRFGVYGVDFGWGKPKKVEVVSIDRTAAISMAESRDGNGGIEVGVVLKKSEMDVFSSFFLAGLETHV
ncbi:Agmatine coumaroyltransferase [Morus notabilis]|uniref:Agmatine coumaroyltransferase n=1 Tax=Morus notabilis TaxID=981085 RepID=W9R4S3_9ROSA|nr:phenolic glucoside malonyltransferase 1 [Morus notabilis]EXB38113.1 Agmatine coumaroyltransferase [Morus notabilis]